MFIKLNLSKKCGKELSKTCITDANWHCHISLLCTMTLKSHKHTQQGNIILEVNVVSLIFYTIEIEHSNPEYIIIETHAEQQLSLHTLICYSRLWLQVNMLQKSQRFHVPKCVIWEHTVKINQTYFTLMIQ